MSAARSLYPNYGLAGLRMGAEEYLALGETQERYELINGVVLMSPSLRPRHSKIFQQVLKQLGHFEDAGGKIDIYCETDLQIDKWSVLCPDICVYARAAPRGIDAIPERLAEAPDLVVEIISPGTEAYDLITKKDEYERRGVKEYWVIDPKDARVRAWHSEGDKAGVGGRFIETLVGGPALSSAAIAGFALDLGALAGVIGRR